MFSAVFDVLSPSTGVDEMSSISELLGPTTESPEQPNEETSRNVKQASKAKDLSV